jgi:hypothetical protein
MLGCGTTNHLQSIQLSTSSAHETTMSSLNVYGMSTTIQLYTWGNYSSGETKLLTGEGVAYQIVLDPVNFYDAYGNVLPDPLPTPTTPQVLQLSPNGLITGIDPPVCTWVDVAAITVADPTPVPAWAESGSYDVTATYDGFTTPPVNIGLATAIGDPNNPALDTPSNPTGGVDNNPNALCGPQPTQ